MDPVALRVAARFSFKYQPKETKQHKAEKVTALIRLKDWTTPEVYSRGAFLGPVPCTGASAVPPQARKSGPGRSRTCILLVCCTGAGRDPVGTRRIERPTSPLSGVRSHQLSYVPVLCRSTAEESNLAKPTYQAGAFYQLDSRWM